jgi:rubrerythrin
MAWKRESALKGRRVERERGLAVVSEAACRSGKRCWPTRSQAKRHLKQVRRLRQTKGEAGHEIRTYECKMCGFWHLTKQTPRVRDAA